MSEYISNATTDRDHLARLREIGPNLGNMVMRHINGARAFAKEVPMIVKGTPGLAGETLRYITGFGPQDTRFHPEEQRQEAAAQKAARATQKAAREQERAATKAMRAAAPSPLLVAGDAILGNTAKSMLPGGLQMAIHSTRVANANNAASTPAASVPGDVIRLVSLEPTAAPAQRAPRERVDWRQVGHDLRSAPRLLAHAAVGAAAGYVKREVGGAINDMKDESYRINYGGQRPTPEREATARQAPAEVTQHDQSNSQSV